MSVIEYSINVHHLKNEKLKVQCKEVKNTTSLLSVIMLLIGHVWAHLGAIVRFNKCSL